MRFYFADPAQQSFEALTELSAGLVQEFEHRGMAVTVLAAADTAAADPKSSVRPFFSNQPHPSEDPFVGWLITFDAAAEAFTKNLQSLVDLASDDRILLRASRPEHLAALMQWLAASRPENVPHVVVWLSEGVDTYLQDEGAGPILRLPDPGADSRPLLYRFATRDLRRRSFPNLRLVTFGGETVAHVYRALLGLEIFSFPSPSDIAAWIIATDKT